MTVLVLRPEPGNAATCARLRAHGLSATAMPLFATRPIDWTPPAPGGFDALLLTSANAVRLAGPDLSVLAALPVVAVGSATAHVARGAGLNVVLVGEGDAAAAVTAARADGFGRLLHLAARERLVLPGVAAVEVYATEPLSPPAGMLAGWRDGEAMLHSPRAAARFAELCDRDALERKRVRLHALSAAVAEAAGSGWGAITVATVPTDMALIDGVVAALALTATARAEITRR